MGRVTAQGIREPAHKTALDMEHLPRDNFHQSFTGRAHRVALLVPLFFLTLLFVRIQAVIAREPDKEILEKSGISYPHGFDRNTVGEIQGKVYALSRSGRGPVCFRLVSDKESYTVLTAPQWFWQRLRGKITDGEEIRVRGSKSLGRDGQLYVIAQEIRVVSSGRSFEFRKKDGRPLWRGHAVDLGERRGFGSHNGGFGAGGPGMGGHGGGR